MEEDCDHGRAACPAAGDSDGEPPVNLYRILLCTPVYNIYRTAKRVYQYLFDGADRGIEVAMVYNAVYTVLRPLGMFLSARLICLPVRRDLTDLGS
jgi:hypothetical protein